MSRVYFDDEPNLTTGTGTCTGSWLPPNQSRHWQGLTHMEGDQLLETMEDLKDFFLQALGGDNVDEHFDGETLAFWSCVTGYVEALATSTKQRYRIFPIPFDALRRLVQSECIPKILQAAVGLTKSAHPSSHREVVKAIANSIWAQTLSKPNTRDEKHANSVYVWLRGSIDTKSLDCFGSTLITIVGCHLHGLESSRLTLSEDHAYETHIITTDQGLHVPGTCEVAVPGTTKAAQAKRGREIAETFSKGATLTPDTSWLYMASNPVVCETLGMTLAAVVGNINCFIDAKGGTTPHKTFASGQLYDLKRDLLWVLYDQGHLSRFPFALMELGDCEENRGSPRASDWVQAKGIPEPVLVNEKLYLDAIQINKEFYNEAQVYPYFLAGHYHKDAGNEGPDSEYRLVHSMQYYAEAARVASKYCYEGVDSLQLNKHITSTAKLIAEDILRPKYRSEAAKDTPRQWYRRQNAVVLGTWLLGFFDSLLKWEEISNDKKFVEILTPAHKHGISKLFQTLELDVRKEVISAVLDGVEGLGKDKELPKPFSVVRSKRLVPGSRLLTALQKPKISIGEMELTILTSDDGDGGGRRSKRARV